MDEIASWSAGGSAASLLTRFDPLVPTIFHEDWWLQIATEGRYATAEVTSGGKVVGRLPYFLTRRKGLKRIDTPTLTHFLGPALSENQGSAAAQFLRRLNITRQLIRQIPRTDACEIKCHAGIDEVIAFQEQKFITAVQFTHEIQPAADDALWQRMRDKTRNVIRRAQERNDVVELRDAHAFIDLYERNLHGHSYLNLAICRDLIDSSIHRARGQVLGAKNRQGDLIGAIFFAWDTRACYYLMSTRDPAAGNGVGSLLVWHGILHAARRKLIFDMDGLTSDGGIVFFAGFGADIRPRYIARRFSLLGNLQRGVRALRANGQGGTQYY